MVKITLKNNGKEKALLAPEQKPLLEILQEDEDFTPFNKFTLNGRKLSVADLDKSVLDLGFIRESGLTLAVEDDVPWETGDGSELIPGSVPCPAKVQVIGCACIIFSAFTPDQLRDFKRYMPEALTARDENGEPAFAVDLDEKSPGSLTKYGAVFSRKTTKQGNATITIVIDPECDDTEETVRKSLGTAILRLADLEECLAAKLPELEKKKGALDEYISAL